MEQKEKRVPVWSILGMVCSVLVIVLAVLQLTGVWEQAIYVFEPLMAVVLLLQARQYWHRHHKTAICLLCAGIAILVITAVIYIMTFIGG